jgi:hypothetical protein
MSSYRHCHKINAMVFYKISTVSKICFIYTYFERMFPDNVVAYTSKCFMNTVFLIAANILDVRCISKEVLVPGALNIYYSCFQLDTSRSCCLECLSYKLLRTLYEVR